MHFNRVNNNSSAGLTKGFTIIEIMIVLVIIGAILAMVVPRVFNALSGGNRKTTEITLRSVAQAVDLYQMDIGSYPKNLQALVEKPKGPEGAKWYRAYLPKMPVDAWKNEFDYKVTPKAKHPYELSSSGDPAVGDQVISVWDL